MPTITIRQGDEPVNSSQVPSHDLRVHVDRKRCQGHARCVAIAPELFELDDFGEARERGDGKLSPALAAKAHLAKANCPELAIEIQQSGGQA
jgi:ferredoxin